ncbi:MAG: hypothetical protein KF829_00280 [Ferruginibacter sp.]|nr:hypothetical protein [Ferruginibacter sp.]
MQNHKYKHEPLPKLELDKKRFRVKFCPCGKSNKDGKFVPYVGHENKGYCHSCGETFLPELPKPEQWDTPQPARYTNPKVQTQKQIDFIPEQLFVKQLNNGKRLYNENHFIQWLGNTQRGEFAFDDKTINHLIESYFIANSNKYKGWVLFPYIDINGKIRDIKAMDYNPTTGKRIATKNGDLQNRCHFIGKKILNNPEANTERCFYGEHRLRGNNKLVRIFESEATATYAAPFYPESVCIATGGSNGCKWTEKGKCSVLQGRTVILYPDIDAHESWEQKAEILRGYGISVQVSTLIKNNALKYAEQNGIDYSELVRLKYDLRDILQHKKLSDFLKPEATEPPPAVQPLVEVKPFEQPKTENRVVSVASEARKTKIFFQLPAITVKPENWGRDITDLENFFANIELPAQPIKLNKCSTIINCSLFIESHFATVKANNGKRTFLPYLNRLQELKQVLTIKRNFYT